VKTVLAKALEGHNTANYRLQLRTKSGDTRTLLINATTRRNRHGHITGVIGVAQDITEMEELKPVRDDFNLVLDKCSDLISKHHLDGRYKSVNEAFGVILGWEPEDLLGKDPYEFFHPDDHEKIQESHKQSVAGKSVVEYRLRCKNGTYVYVETSGTLIHDVGNVGTPQYLLCITRDITDRKKRHEVETKLAIADATRKKDIQANHFTRHEVKNGILNAQARIQGMSEILGNAVSDGRLSGVVGDVRQQLDTISSELQHTLQTVLSEAMAKELINGMYEARPEAVDLSVIFRRVMDVDERVRVVSHPKVMPQLKLDPQLVYYIFRNAYSNALKYGHSTDPVGVSVVLENGEFTLSVDNSPGPDHERLIDLENPNIIFEEHTRLHDDFCSAESEGNGAWIMRQCAMAMRGTCSILFTPEGTHFEMKCPCEVAPEEKVDKSILQNSDVPPNTIFIGVDDSKMQRLAMQRMFRNEGFDESCVYLMGEKYGTVTWMLERMIQRIGGSEFVVCIIDQNLDWPQGNVLGTDLSRLLKEKLESQGRKIVTFIRSANDSAHDVKLYREHATDFMPKTIMRRGKFREIVIEHMANIYGEKIVSNNEVMRVDPEMLQMIQEELKPLVDNLSTQDGSQEWNVVWSMLHKIKGCANLVESGSRVGTTIDKMRGKNYPPNWQDKVRDLCRWGRHVMTLS